MKIIINKFISQIFWFIFAFPQDCSFHTQTRRGDEFDRERRGGGSPWQSVPRGWTQWLGIHIPPLQLTDREGSLFLSLSLSTSFSLSLFLSLPLPLSSPLTSPGRVLYHLGCHIHTPCVCEASSIAFDLQIRMWRPCVGHPHDSKGESLSLSLPLPLSLSPSLSLSLPLPLSLSLSLSVWTCRICYERQRVGGITATLRVWPIKCSHTTMSQDSKYTMTSPLCPWRKVHTQSTHTHTHIKHT